MNGQLSLAIIVKNAGATLEKCLSTFSTCVDEIVVVDTGSTDNSIEIAKKYTDKIFNFTWINDFSAARNFSFEKTTLPWIFWCDADDYILSEDAKKVRELDLSDKEIVVMQYYYCLDEFGQPVSIVPRERIVKRSLGIKWEERIHEYLPLRGKLHVTDIVTYHQKQHGTSERNIQILEEIVKERPEDSRNIYYLGKEYLDFGRNDEGAKLLEEFVKRADGFWEDIFIAHYRLAQLYMPTDEAKFKFHVFESLKIEERRAEPYYLVAQYWDSKKQYDRAAQWYEFCTTIHRPKDLLSSYQPEFYTWLPCLQLCVVYNTMGDLQKAYDWNEKALAFRPQDSRMISNKKILQGGLGERKAKATKKDGQGKKLNLGCGGKAEPGYTNVDIFKGPVVDEVFDLDEIPYLDGTIGGINSEHSLEHVGWQRADKALQEWYRVLKPGGQLMLKIPDLGDCCKKYLETPLENATHKQWYKYTIYGIQKTQAGEPDEAQTHRAGWSTEEMCAKLEGLGFVIDYAQRYDGWDTPSTGILAVKPVSEVKVGWIAPFNYEAAQTRIRVLTVNRWLRSRGWHSAIVDYPDIINKNYDMCIVGKTFDENHYKNIKMLKQHGKTVICDLCEEITGSAFPYVDQILAICDLVVCCSRELERIVQKINPNTTVIEDAYEL